MAQRRSFTNYVADRFYNEMFATIQNYTLDNYDDLDLRLYRVRNIGGIELSDIEVKFVSVNDLPDMKIEFDVVVEVELEVRELNPRYDESEICRQWFMLKCSGDLNCNLDDFKITSVAEYTSKDKQPRPMSDSLVPIINKEQLDSVATEFLRRYYPEAISTPMAIEPQKLAERMDLDVLIREITGDFSIFGQIFFHDTEAELYDSAKDELVRIPVKARTIFVDPKAYFLRNLGSVNNTIVHECVHWDKHRKAFELERLYNSSVSSIKCQVVGGIIGSNKDATDWMEWQANALAPRIQMPLGSFKTKAFEFIKQFRDQLGGVDLIEVIEPVIDAMATFFSVSRIAAKIRMIDVGYEEAISAFTFIDGRYIKPHRFKKGALQRNQTFSISAIDAAIQSLTNPELIPLIEDGSYQYVEAHFVLNHPKYIEQDIFGQTRLTDYARTHMEECCLIFDLSIDSIVKERYHSECFLNRDKSNNISFQVEYKNGYENSTEEKKAQLLKDVISEDFRIYNELSNSYTRSLAIVRNWRDVTFKELADRTKLSERTIRRIFNGEEPGSINSLILICLGLHLPPVISNHIIKSSPFSLNLSNENHQWYNFVLHYKFALTMDEIRSFLMQHGVDPL